MFLGKLPPPTEYSPLGKFTPENSSHGKLPHRKIPPSENSSLGKFPPGKFPSRKIPYLSCKFEHLKKEI